MSQRASQKHIRDEVKLLQSDLFKAAERGHFELVKEIFARLRSLQALEVDHRPLCAAFAAGQPALAIRMLRGWEAAGLKTPPEVSVQALSTVCALGQLDIAQQIWRHAGSQLCVESARQAVLEAACKHGHVHCLEWALELGADPQRLSQSGGSAMHLACSSGHAEIVKRLLQAGVSPNGVMGELKSPLIACLQAGHENLAWLLLQNGAFINAGIQEDSSPLHAACAAGFLELAQALYRRNPSALDPACQAKCLQHAAQAHQVEVLRWLLETDARKFIDHPGDGGKTALHLACVGPEKRNADPAQRQLAIELLIAYGASPYTPDQDNCTPLMLAAGTPGISVASMLFERSGLNARNVYGETALTRAVEKNRPDVVEQLVDCGADLVVADDDDEADDEDEEDDEDPGSLLMQAASVGAVEIMRYLLQLNLPVDEINVYAESAVHHACEANSVPALQLLRGRGADMGRSTNTGETPLLHAARRKAVEAVSWLLKNGLAGVNEVGAGETVLHLAARYGDMGLLEAILPFGPNLNARDFGDRNTAAMLAGTFGRLEMLKRLQREGADLLLTNPHNHNAVDLAMLGGEYACVDYLLGQGISPNEPLGYYKEHGHGIRLDLLGHHGLLARASLDESDLLEKKILELPPFSGPKLSSEQMRRWEASLREWGCLETTIERLSGLPNHFMQLCGPLARTSFARPDEVSLSSASHGAHSALHERMLSSSQGRDLMMQLLCIPNEDLEELDGATTAGLQALSLQAADELQIISEAAARACEQRREALRLELPQAIMDAINIRGMLHEQELEDNLRQVHGLFSAVADLFVERVKVVWLQLRTGSADLAAMGSLAERAVNEARAYRESFTSRLRVELQHWNQRHAQPAMLRAVFSGDKPNRVTNHLLHQWHDLCAALDAPLKRPLSSYLFGHHQLPELDSA